MKKAGNNAYNLRWVMWQIEGIELSEYLPTP